jgi:hypothetical protein
MSTRDKLIKKVQDAPDALVQELLDYAQFLKQRHEQDRREPMALAESSLSKDWLRPEEDEAWRGL